MTQVDAGQLADLDDGAPVVIDVEGLDIAVFRDGENVYAIADRCSHAEASLAEG
ncbi:MAG: Rieske (2Fe-2S) protein, partial [Acidimicrobiia bacterium]